MTRHLISYTDTTDVTKNPLSDDKRHLTSSTDNTDLTMNPLSDDKRHLTSSTDNTYMTMNPLSDDKTLTLQQQQPLAEHANWIVFPCPQKRPLWTSMVLTVNLRTQMRLVVSSK